MRAHEIAELLQRADDAREDARASRLGRLEEESLEMELRLIREEAAWRREQEEVAVVPVDER